MLVARSLFRSPLRTASHPLAADRWGWLPRGAPGSCAPPPGSWAAPARARLQFRGPRVGPSRTLSVSAGERSRSRLGCQICLTKSMDNMTVRVPEVVVDARVSIDLGKNS